MTVFWYACVLYGMALCAPSLCQARVVQALATVLRSGKHATSSLLSPLLHLLCAHAVGAHVLFKPPSPLPSTPSWGVPRPCSYHVHADNLAVDTAHEVVAGKKVQL